MFRPEDGQQISEQQVSLKLSACVKGKGKYCPYTRHEGVKEECKYSSTEYYPRQ